MSKKKQVIKAEVDDIYYWVECPSCNNEQTFWGSDFNENEKYACVYCEHRFIVKLVNKLRSQSVNKNEANA